MAINLFGIYVLLNCYALILHSNGYKALSILYNNNYLLCWLYWVLSYILTHGNIVLGFPDSALSIHLKGRHSPRTRSLDTTTSTSSFDKNNFYTKLVTAHSSVIKDDAQNILELTNNCSSDAIHFYKTKVEINKQESINLCNSTLTQMGPIWLTSRKLRITGTSAYKLFTFFRGSLQNKNICSKLKSLLFSNFSGNSATFYGVENEPLAIKAFEKLKNITVIKSGIIVNIHCPWLGFSPDGFFISDNEMYLIEIKCPVMGKTMCGLELLMSLKYIVINSIGVPSLKKKTFLLWANSVRFITL